MKREHTPGPWEIFEDGDIYVCAPSRATDPKNPQHNAIIATFRTDDQPAHVREETRANATLAAAAPAMLAALEQTQSNKKSAEETLEQIARFTRDGDPMENGEEHKMSIDDAFDTVGACIDLARKFLRERRA